MDSLIEDVKFTFNRLSAAHDQSVYSWDFALDGTGRDTTAILRLLLKEIERVEIERDDRVIGIAAGHIEGMETTLGRFLDDEEIASIARGFALTPKQELRIREVRGPKIVNDGREG